MCVGGILPYQCQAILKHTSEVNSIQTLSTQRLHQFETGDGTQAEELKFCPCRLIFQDENSKTIERGGWALPR